MGSDVGRSNGGVCGSGYLGTRCEAAKASTDCGEAVGEAIGKAIGCVKDGI